MLSDNLNSNVSGSFSAGIYNEGETIIKNDATMNIRADSEKIMHMVFML